jgi:hypothetical protein
MGMYKQLRDCKDGSIISINANDKGLVITNNRRECVIQYEDGGRATVDLMDNDRQVEYLGQGRLRIEKLLTFKEWVNNIETDFVKYQGIIGLHIIDGALLFENGSLIKLKDDDIVEPVRAGEYEIKIIKRVKDNNG